MSTQKTANYQLNQWVKSDRILMEEFNADNLKIDDAIATVIPAGLICLWSGAADALPAGWALCNGSNGTPDLRGRFLVGAGGSYAVGDTGGDAHCVVRQGQPFVQKSVTYPGGEDGPQGAALQDQPGFHRGHFLLAWFFPL